MFTQSCFIRKNSKELRDKLKGLGHTICKCCEFDGTDWLKVSCNTKMQYSVHGIGYTEEEYEIYGDITQEEVFQYFLKTTTSIDCGDNEELFLAIAALRDDTDKNQYWICDKVSVTIGKTYYPGNYIYYQYDEFFDKQNWHKATVEEIIEHFKNK